MTTPPKQQRTGGGSEQRYPEGRDKARIEVLRGMVDEAEARALSAEATATQLRKAIEAHKADSWVVGHNRLDRKLYEALSQVEPATCPKCLGEPDGWWCEACKNTGRAEDG